MREETTSVEQAAAWAEAQVFRSGAARTSNVFDLRTHRVVAQAEAPSPTAIEAADAARRSYPHPERRLSDMGSGIRLAEHHVPGWAAHAVSEIGHPSPTAAPRIPRVRKPTLAALLVLGAAAVSAWVLVVADIARGLPRPF